MPRMSEQVAQDVMWLSTQDRFTRLLDHFKEIEKELQTQINMTGTPKDEREILVHVKDCLSREVIQVIKLAQHVLRQKEKVQNG